MLIECNEGFGLKIDDTEIFIIKGDITELEVDTIVNAANNHFWMGGGVAGSIKRKGGTGIEKEATSQGPKSLGEVIVTGAGRLKANYIIHAAVMGQDLVTDEDKIRNATYNTLIKADGLNVNSIAFPAFGTGVGGFPIKRCREIMLKTIGDFLEKHKGTSIRKIVFSLFDEDAFNIFKSGIDISRTSEKNTA